MTKIKQVGQIMLIQVDSIALKCHQISLRAKLASEDIVKLDLEAAAVHLKLLRRATQTLAEDIAALPKSIREMLSE